MTYNAPPSKFFLKNSAGTDSDILWSELTKLATETANLQNQISTGQPEWSDTFYIGDPELDQSWKVELRAHLSHKEMQFFRKEGAGTIEENWVQNTSFPREFGEMYRYNGTTPRTLTTQDTWYPSINLIQGNIQTVTFGNDAGDTYLQVPSMHGGLYRVNWVTTFSAPVNHFFEMSVSVNDVVQTNCVSRRKSNTSDVAPLSGTGIINIPDSGKVRIVTRCISTSNIDVTFVHSNINIQRL